jgi:hypothetical protein
MDGSAGFKAKEVERFVETLRRTFQLPVHLVDERLTSYEAEERVAPKARRAARGAGAIDSIAAELFSTLRSAAGSSINRYSQSRSERDTVNPQTPVRTTARSAPNRASSSQSLCRIIRWEWISVMKVS